MIKTIKKVFSQLPQLEVGIRMLYWKYPTLNSLLRRIAHTSAKAPGKISIPSVYEPGFTRLGQALARDYPGLPTPIYRFMFSDEFAWGFPPRPACLDAHLALLAELAPEAPWMVAGLGVDIRPLIAPAVARGGHVRVGLEDAPWRSELSNGQWVEAAARAIRAAGAEPASAMDARVALAATPTA